MNLLKNFLMLSVYGFSIAFAFADDQNHMVFPEKDIEGMLYFEQIDEAPISILEQIIRSMHWENAIQWKDRAGLRRKTFEFGVSFKEIDKNGQIIRKGIPPFIAEIRKKLVTAFQDHLTEKDPEKYENCIITIYSQGDGIKPHIDRDYFGPDILGMIIVPDDSVDPNSAVLCFTSSEYESSICLPEKRGMAYLIQGSLRTHWEHQLPPVVKERISIQFRTFIEKNIAVKNNG